MTHTQTSIENRGSEIALAERNLTPLVRGFERLREFVTQYNQSAEGLVLDSDKLIAALKGAGAVNDSTLKLLSESEISKITDQSLIIARALHKEFVKTDDAPERELRKRLPTRHAVQTYPLEELIEKYDPADIGSSVVAELRHRITAALGTNASPRFVVFDEAGKVIVPETLRLLQEALQGDADLTVVSINRVAHTTYRLGQSPKQIVAIQPITGEQLRSNGQDKFGLNWSEIRLECQQMLKLAVESKEIEFPIKRRDLSYYYNISAQPQGLEQLMTEFPSAAQLFAEAKALGNLPSLRAYRHSNRDKGVDPAELIKTRRY